MDETASDAGQYGEFQSGLSGRRLSVFPAIGEGRHGLLAIARVQGSAILA